MDTTRFKKAVNDYGPLILKYIVDRIVDLIKFLKKQIVYTIRFALGKA